MVDETLLVSDFILEEQSEWDIPKLKEAFNDRSVEQILTIPIPYGTSSDSYIWLKEVTGKFTIRLAYKASQEEKRADPMSEIWRRI